MFNATDYNEPIWFLFDMRNMSLRPCASSLKIDRNKDIIFLSSFLSI